LARKRFATLTLEDLPFWNSERPDTRLWRELAAAVVSMVAKYYKPEKGWRVGSRDTAGRHSLSRNFVEAIRCPATSLGPDQKSRRAAADCDIAAFKRRPIAARMGAGELLVEGEVWDFVPPGFLAVTIQSQDRFAA
jgi:hypothetical protein